LPIVYVIVDCAEVLCVHATVLPEDVEVAVAVGVAVATEVDVAVAVGVADVAVAVAVGVAVAVPPEVAVAVGVDVTAPEGAAVGLSGLLPVTFPPPELQPAIAERATTAVKIKRLDIQSLPVHGKTNRVADTRGNVPKTTPSFASVSWKAGELSFKSRSSQ
jgi:hypothetical protein